MMRDYFLINCKIFKKNHKKILEIIKSEKIKLCGELIFYLKRNNHQLYDFVSDRFSFYENFLDFQYLKICKNDKKSFLDFLVKRFLYRCLNMGYSLDEIKKALKENLYILGVKNG